MQEQHWLTSRKIAERIVVEGVLELLTPAHFGGDELSDAADLSLLRDPLDGVSALLPGASIAGALRNYWRERSHGYRVKAKHSKLFGARRFSGDEKDEEDDEGSQSLLIVEDARSEKPAVALRDGVKIDSKTRTAEEKKLFDMEVLEVGTHFKLRFELLIPEGQVAALCEELVTALVGFEQGEIRMGARKRRGFGRCKVNHWTVHRYDVRAGGLLAWLTEGRTWSQRQIEPKTGPSIAAILGAVPKRDNRRRAELAMTFGVDGSVLVRSGAGEADQGADMVHLRRKDGAPVLPGTGIAGVLRARAERIVKTLAPNGEQGKELIENMFGVALEDEKVYKTSRLVVDEAEIKDVHQLVQHRIRVDRFTGGAMDNYLFTEAPVFGGEQSYLEMGLTLHNPCDHEIGLLLLLLKDLWTGDLPVGGESSVGRGRLCGKTATLTVTQNGELDRWCITQTDTGLNISDAARLQEFVDALVVHLAGESEHAKETG